MKRYSMIFCVVALCCVGIVMLFATSANAQCSTCPQPVVAFSPVVQTAVVPTTTVVLEPYRGWYPGRFFDNMRMRRWGYSAPTTVTTAFAPTAMPMSVAMPITTAMPVTSTFVPQTVGFAPMATTTFATPHVTAFAPLGQRQVFMQPTLVQSPVMATSFADAGCSTCATPAPCSACSACELAAPCSSCAGSTTVVEQATFAAAPAAAPCTNCAQGSSVTYTDQGVSQSTGTQTPQPQLTPQEAAPLQSNYPEVTPPQNTKTPDPGPAAEQKPSDSSTYFEPPALFIPGDRTAQTQETAKPVNRAPSVNVWNAVYREPVNANQASTSTGTSQAEIDAAGWSSVPAN
ncbi:MAG: hypothetical protein SH868_07855 [Bythopirellula sp.]|nr:hypothetical protein [Bythopirellula sp.]